MNNDLPLSFDELAKSAGSSSAGGYPYQLKGSDLDKNFVWAACEFVYPLKVTEQIGQFGYTTRIISMITSNTIPDPPIIGTWVLGSVNGKLSWLETQSCS